MPQPYTDALFLFGALLLILASAELFTNGVEWLGQRLNLSEAVVGSVLAAVGTALPETLIPVVAVGLVGGATAHEVKAAHAVGIGAIAGAPFMLSTLTLSLCGIAIIMFARTGRRSPQLSANRIVISRELRFFIVAYSIALGCTALRDVPELRWLLAVGLLSIYGLYLKQTFSHAGEVGEAPEHLHFERLLRLGRGLFVIVIQVLVGLGGILGGAYLFVEHTRSLSMTLGVPPEVLALVIAPVATELPEKVNSILWARQGKDTLALGNVTGALVFQSCLPAAFGIAFTRWDLGLGTIISGIVAVGSGAAFLGLMEMGKLSPRHLAVGFLFYSATISWLMFTHLIE